MKTDITFRNFRGPILAALVCLPLAAFAQTGATASVTGTASGAPTGKSASTSAGTSGPSHKGTQTNAGPNVDNSGVNSTTKGSAGLNAGDQTSGTPDMEITRQIRRALTSDHSLSTYAQNIKIITVNGVVTLKGPVKSAAEKQKASQVATAVTGVSKIQNEITIKQ